jgi:hypothetical protein
MTHLTTYQTHGWPADREVAAARGASGRGPSRPGARAPVRWARGGFGRLRARWLHGNVA